MNSVARPIVLARAKVDLPRVAPENDELGVMLPYTPLHHLLFAAGAPEILVMTSANRSSEPIAYRDEDALQQLSGIADAFLIGERPIARRVDDSVARVGRFRPDHSSPRARIRPRCRRDVSNRPAHPCSWARTSRIRSLSSSTARPSSVSTSETWTTTNRFALFAKRSRICFRCMRSIRSDLLRRSRCASSICFDDRMPPELPAAEKCAVQHHRAHIASVLAERGAWDKRVIGVSFDGTGYGDDGTIWGGEIFAGSVREGFERVAHLRAAALPGGDAAASHPVQAAAGFLAQLNDLPDLTAPPFFISFALSRALQLVASKHSLL